MEEPKRAEAQARAYGPEGCRSLSAGSVAGIRELVRPGETLWLDFALDSDPGRFEEAAREFGIHVLAAEDALNPHQRAKVEAFEGHLLIVLNTYEPRPDGQLEPENVAVILGERYVLTVQATRADCWEPVRRRLAEPASPFLQRGPDYLASQLVDAVVDSAFPVIESVADRLEEIEERMLQSSAQGDLQALYRVRADLVGLRRALWPTRDAVRTLATEGLALVEERSRKYFRDAYDHAAQAIDVAETMRERVGNLTDLHFSAVSLRQNEVLKVLTVVSSVFIPLTFVAGVYGMNFDPDASPWNMPELRHPYGYVAVCAAMAAIGLAQLWFFRRKGWLP